MPVPEPCTPEPNIPRPFLTSISARLLEYPRRHLVFIVCTLATVFLLPVLFFFSSRTAPTHERDLTAVATPPTPTQIDMSEEQRRLQETRNKPKRLAQGKQTFEVSGSNRQQGPTITQVTIDPYDPAIGTQQTVQVLITGTSPLLTVRATLVTDNGERVYPLMLSSGQPLSGTWSNSWTTTETHDVTYLLKITASDGKTDDSVTLTIR